MSFNRLALMIIALFVFTGCSSSKQPFLEVEAKLSNQFARTPLTVEFMAGSNLRADNISYRWYINKTQIEGNQRKMKYTFRSPGEYIVEVYLLSSNSQPLYKSLSLQVVNNKLPECDFSYTEPAYVGDLVHFIAQCTDIDGKIVKYVWDFGDGKVMQTGRNRYAKAGSYIVTLYATDDANGVSTTSKRVLIRAR